MSLCISELRFTGKWVKVSCIKKFAGQNFKTRLNLFVESMPYQILCSHVPDFSTLAVDERSPNEVASEIEAQFGKYTFSLISFS